MTLSATTAPVGDLLRTWRERRKLSQLDLAGDAEISARHLSFVETGRSTGSREMLLRLADCLAMPLRAQNRLLLAGGFAPVHAERSLDDPMMAAAKAAVDAILTGHAPFPALAVDRHWNLVAANDAVMALLDGVALSLLEAPINVLRVSLHPEGLAPRIDNLAEWRGHLLHRLNEQIEQSGDPVLAALGDELTAYPAPESPAKKPQALAMAIAIPLRIRGADGIALSFLSTTTMFGTPVEVTLSELALECFYPADEQTRASLLGAAQM